MNLAGPLAALVASAAACSLLVALDRVRVRVASDAVLPNLHKVHRVPVPRIGGIGIFIGVAASALALSAEQTHWLALCLLAALPALAGGLLEDFTGRVSPYSRLLFAFGAAAVGFLLLDARITDLDLPGDDSLFRYEVFAFGFTLFAVGGYAHATNIIDGTNGLSGFVSVAVLAAIAWVAHQTGDERIFGAALVLMAATVGFLVWNFPRGLLFAGDGGAYFLGLAIAELAVLLVHRNSEVSPWFALLALWYPVWETLFSAYRRKAIRRRSPATPDALHLHTLVYRRVMQGVRKPQPRSAYTSLGMLALSLTTLVPAVLFWDETWVLQACAAGFALVYLWLYRRIVRFATPRLPFLRDAKRG